jgi:ERCC4-type nuclease
MNADDIMQLPLADEISVLPRGSFDIFLCLDNREIRTQNSRDFLQQSLNRLGVPTLTRALDLGDMLWLACSREDRGAEVVLNYVVERKRLDDLVSSIKDGRFKEQKMRLSNCVLQNKIYLVEEVDSGGQADEFGRDRIRSAMSLTQILNDIRVERTQNMDDTVALLTSIHRRIVKKYEVNNVKVIVVKLFVEYLQNSDLYVIPDDWLSRGNCLNVRKQLESRDGHAYHVSYEAYCEMNSKSKQHTIREVWFKQLTCIRGLTVEKASLMVEQYPTMRSFAQALLALPDTKRRMELIRSLSGSIARKAFGGTLCQRIVEFFCSDPYPSANNNGDDE